MTMETLKQVLPGWSKILGGRSGWDSHFRFDAEGMNGAFIAYGGAVLFTIVVLTLRLGFPQPAVMMIVVLGHLVPPVGLVLLTSALKRIAGVAIETAKFVVPGLYLLALLKVLEGLGILVGVPLAGAISTVGGILCYRLARVNEVGTVQAIAYGLAIFVLLAVVLLAL
ncbi:hypothetical protein [Pelagibacterium sp.]|uniref:hypothetical protein n=1 Tax=Pelagibacterium sp. TaxID=1967288 RepID=UPI003BAC8506